MENRIYTTILIKRRVSGEPGPPSSLHPGELAMNEPSNTLYVGETQSEELSGNSIIDLGVY